MAGEAHLRAGSSSAACLKRAEDFHHWCGNDADDGPQVAATHNPAGLTQIYSPAMCDKGWSLLGEHCYKHFWQNLGWYEAEATCQAQGGDGHLASIHSQVENDFVFTLSLGLSAWIGYVEMQKEVKFEWTDKSEDDFENLAKNCSGREQDPDCQPDQTAKQWYNHFQGHEAATFVCKKRARSSDLRLVNCSAADLLVKSWDELLSSKEEVGSSVEPSAVDLSEVAKKENCSALSDKAMCSSDSIAGAVQTTAMRVDSQAPQVAHESTNALVTHKEVVYSRPDAFKEAALHDEVIGNETLKILAEMDIRVEKKSNSSSPVPAEAQKLTELMTALLNSTMREEQKANQEQQEVCNNTSTGATGKFFHKPSVASWLAAKPVASENTSVGQFSRVVVVPAMMQFGLGAISFGIRPGIKAL